MANIPILIHPYFSNETLISTGIADYIINYLYDFDIKVIDIPGFHARPRTVLNALWRQKLLSDSPKLIIYIGHGLEDSWTGYEYPFKSFIDTLLSLPSDVLLDTSMTFVNKLMTNNLRNSIIVTIACRTLETLGPFLVKNGVRAYLGSTADMDISLSDLDNDTIRDIDDLYSIPIKTLVTGGTVKEAVEHIKLKARKYVNLCGSVSNIEQQCCIRLFEMVEQHYGYVGDGNARWII